MIQLAQFPESSAMTSSPSGGEDLPRLMSQAASLVDAGNYAEAREIGRAMAARDYDHAADASDVGVILTRMGMHEEAERQFESALRMNPAQASHHYNLATVLRFRGELGRAEQCLDVAIDLDPDDADAWSLRSSLRKQTPGSNHVEGLRSALDRVGDRPRSKVAICYALAKELEDLGRDDECFAALLDGSATRRAHMEYDLQRDVATLAEIERIYDEGFFDRNREGFADSAPIFVIGMPRTGTTLVEQILGRHSAVQAAGELSNFSMQLGRITRAAAEHGQLSGGSFVELSSGIDFGELGQAYVASTRALRGGHAHFVDKLPFNFLYAGLIHVALPKAKIIHVRRDPMDTCFAVFKTLFDAAYPFSYDLEELARYFVAYRRLMDHWYATLPGVIHSVQYEELASNPGTVIPQMLSFCDLSWEKQCLDTENADGVSTTASAAQVRRGIYTSSIGRWRRFEDHLQPVIDVLEDNGIEISRSGP